jgi:hypothetical protein
MTKPKKNKIPKQRNPFALHGLKKKIDKITSRKDKRPQNKHVKDMEERLND